MKRVVFLVGVGVLLALTQAPAGAQDWQTPFQDTGTWTPVPIPTDGDMSLAQTFEVTLGLQGVGIQSPTWNGTGAGYRMRLFAWNTDYATSIAGTVLAEKVETEHPDNAWTYLVLDDVIAPGQYLVVTDEPVRGTGNVGHWAWSDSSAAGAAVPAAYSNGSLMAGSEFSFAVAEAEYVEPVVLTWQSLFQDSGTWTPVAMPTDGDMSLAQSFQVSQGLLGVGIQSPTWGGTGAGYRVRLFAWNTDYATSVAGTVLAEKTEADHADNAWTYLAVGDALAPGQYLVVTDQPVRGTGNVGHWAWSSSSAAGGAVPAAYSNGSLMDGYEFSFAVALGDYDQPGLVLTFDCGADGFWPTHGVALTDNVGSLTYVPVGADPYAMRSTPIDGSAFPELAFQLNVANAASNDFPAAFFWFANGGHGRAGFQLSGDGDYTVRMNVPAAKDSGAASWDASVGTIRLDFPDGDATAFINAGTVFTLDWLSITDDPNFVPVATDTASQDCDGDGVSNGYEALLGTNPFDADSDDDGVDDGMELQFGTDPLDAESVPVIPVTSGVGLAAIALALALAGLVLVRRRTA